MATAPLESTSHRWRPEVWLIIGLSLFFGVIYVQYALKMSHSENGSRSAFLRWRTQLADLDDGVNVWEKYAYPNPPIMAILLRPFMCLPPTLGASLWFACKALLAIAAVVLVFALLDPSGQRFPLWAKGLAVMLTLRPFEGDLVHGNVNVLILFLIVAAVYAFCQRRDGLAGVLLGLSIACKLTPALFLVYFLWKRAWTTTAACVASVGFFVLVAPAVVFGWSANLDYLQSWHRQMVEPYAAGVVTSEHKNQSLPGVLHRMLSAEPSFSDYDGDRKVVLETHNLIALRPDVVQGIVIGCMMLFAAAGAYFCRSPVETRLGLPNLAEASVVVLGMLLFCERTWKHHCATLLLPFSVIAYCLGTRLFSARVRWHLGIMLALAALLMLSTATGVDDQHDRLGKLAQVYGAYFWAFLLLLAAMLLVLRQFRRVDAATREARRSNASG